MKVRYIGLLLSLPLALFAVSSQANEEIAPATDVVASDMQAVNADANVTADSSDLALDEGSADEWRGGRGWGGGRGGWGRGWGGGWGGFGGWGFGGWGGWGGGWGLGCGGGWGGWGLGLGGCGGWGGWGGYGSFWPYYAYATPFAFAPYSLGFPYFY